MKILDYKKKIKRPLRQATLCFLIREEKILLAMKKRGFAEGKINGVGGKVNEGEGVEDAAKREAFEEISVKVNSLEQVAVLNFYFTHNSNWNQQVVVYKVTDWDGVPKESEEVDPTWYQLNNIPYDQMWVDDILWLPKVLEEKKVRAEFLLNKDEKMLDYHLDEL